MRPWEPARDPLAAAILCVAIILAGIGAGAVVLIIAHGVFGV
jgi:hypothetical protein